MKNNKDLVIYAIDGMNNITESNTYGCDLHSALFNTDYFIIGYYNAEQWLINNVGIFQAIETIREYENDTFGEVTTDFSSSEKVVNMYSYIIGEEILNDCKALRRANDRLLTKRDIKSITKELESML